MSKKLRKILTILVALLLVFFTFKQNGLLAMIGNFFIEEDDKDPFVEDIEYIYNGDYKVDLIIYGDEVEFREEVEYRRITEITEDSIASDADYIFLIICDRSGKTAFDIDTLRFLKEYADKNLRFNFEYVGESKMDLYTSGEVFDEYSVSSDDLSFGYIVYEGTRIQHGGVWSQEEERYDDKINQKLMDNVMYFMKNVIKNNE